jgi:hypothetical protein
MNGETEYLEEERQSILEWLFAFIFEHRGGTDAEARDKLDRLGIINHLLADEL